MAENSVTPNTAIPTVSQSFFFMAIPKQAHNHCQIGNTRLALDMMVK